MKKLKTLLHACCGPCATIGLDRLSDGTTDVFWYNPNIEPKEEHDKRLTALETLAGKTGTKIVFSDYDYEYENKLWHEFVKGLELEPEGAKRCQKCFEFRLKKMKDFCKQKIYDLAATSLTVSPYKDTTIINKIGADVFAGSDTNYWAIDLKENEGYKRSIELSKKYGLYRQKYCGCLYSKNQKSN